MSVLATEVALAEARDAARAGDLAVAAEHLAGLDTDGPDVLDLRARVLAQAGELDEAEWAWRALADLRPGDAAAAAGIAAVDDVRSGRRRRRVAAGVAAAVAILGAAVAGGTLAVGALAGAPPTATPTPTPAPAAPAAPPAGAAPPAAPAVPDTASAAAAGLADAVTAPGVTARPSGAVVEVSFEEGLFTRGTTLTPEGLRALEALGPRLTGRVGEVEIVGRSVAVDGGPATGGSTVALARAQTVAAVLAEDGPPLTTYDLSVAEQTRATGARAAAARTVELRLVPATGG